MTDLVERLRAIAPEGTDHLHVDTSERDPFRFLNLVMREAAHEIERLRGEVERYRKGLQEVHDLILKEEPRP